MNSSLNDILKLSVAERILLVEEIWNSIASEPQEEATSLTASQKKEIDRRLALYRSGQTKTYSWNEIKSGIRNPS
jgi:putative addiction module component (TIGR02574 family)